MSPISPACWARFARTTTPVRKKSFFLLGLMRNSVGWRYADEEELGAPVDYHEMRGHVRLGTVVVHAVQLREKLLNRTPVDETEDVALRGRVAEAIRTIADFAGVRDCMRFHYLFWNLFRSICVREHPYCRTPAPDNALPEHYAHLVGRDNGGACPFRAVCPAPTSRCATSNTLLTPTGTRPRHPGPGNLFFLPRGKLMRANAIYAGGGVKGAALAGCLRAAEQQGVKFVGHGGTSAGSMVALMAAVGYTGEQLERILVEELDFRDLLDDGGGRLEGVQTKVERISSALSSGRRVRQFWAVNVTAPSVLNALGVALGPLPGQEAQGLSVEQDQRKGARIGQQRRHHVRAPAQSWLFACQDRRLRHHLPPSCHLFPGSYRVRRLGNRRGASFDLLSLCLRAGFS